MKKLKKEKNKSASENGVIGFILIALVVIVVNLILIWCVMPPINK